MAVEWKKIKTDLSPPCGRVYLRCDGYLVAASIVSIKMRLVVAVYVNGLIKGDWIWVGLESRLGEMDEITRKFYCLKKVRPPKGQANHIKAMEKIYGKRKCKQIGVYDHRYMALPEFATPGAFVTHIKKHCQLVEIIDFETYEIEMAKRKESDAA